MGFLTDKRALITGVASNRSIAWGIARAMHREGADLAFLYQNQRLEDRVRTLASSLDSSLCYECDVASDASIDLATRLLAKDWDALDICVHAVAFAPREELRGDFLEVSTRDGYRLAHDISAYSFIALAKRVCPMMQDRTGALLTLTYLGAGRAVPNYNVMGPAKASLEASVRYMASALGPKGIRVNAISAGPIKTLAAAGIADFRRFLEHAERNAPLRRNVGPDEVGNAAAFLCSDLASGVTGEILYVDAGYHVMGMSDDTSG